jgi:hypothetical protein
MPMRRLPWITMAAAAVFVLNPVGLEFIHGAFLSGEQLSRNIAQPIVYAAAVIVVVLGLLEWWVRKRLAAR